MKTFNTKDELNAYLAHEGVDTSTWNENQYEKFSYLEEPMTPRLDFPAEYNIQDLAIKIKAAMDASTPQVLDDGVWHLPFITDNDWDMCHELYAGYPDKKESIHDTVVSMLIKISAARCARTSYGKHLGKTIEDDLDLANDLARDNHWSPFEHQGRATEHCTESARVSDVGTGFFATTFRHLEEGLSIKFDLRGDSVVKSYWSRNFNGFIQARAILDQ
jgi:hypothetical protein